MQFILPRTKSDQDSSIIPLINVVFLILVFLIIAGQIANSDVYQVEIPQSLSQSDPKHEVLVLIINTDSQMFLDNEAVEMNELTGMLEKRSQATLEPQVLIKADAGLLVADLRPILAKLKAAGLTRVSMATLQPA